MSDKIALDEHIWSDAASALRESAGAAARNGHEYRMVRPLASVPERLIG
jgi:hypothetical protein